MTLQQIKYVFEIAQCGSISKAADKLYLTQPYLSKLLKSLEDELHITIFNRTKKGVTLTEEGASFMQYANPLLDQERKIMEIYNQKKREPTYMFTLSLQHYPFVIKAFYQFFLKKNPSKYEIYIRETGMEQVIRDVFEQRSSLGIIAMSDTTEAFLFKYLEAHNLEFHKIKTLQPKIYFRQNHPMASKSAISIAEMQEYPFASFESDLTSPFDFSYSEEIVIPDIFQIKRHIHVLDRSTMMNTLSETDAFSIGSGIFPEGFVGPKLVSRPIIDNVTSMRLGWIQMAHSHLSDDVQLFLDKLIGLLSSDIDI